MSFVPLTQTHFRAFEHRVSCLDVGAQRRWGALEPAGMLVHLNYTLRVSMGEVEVEDRSTLISRVIFRRIAFQTPLPWPKGKIKAPAVFTPAPHGTLEECRAELIAEMSRFVQLAEREPARKTFHPFFGAFTLT